MLNKSFLSIQSDSHNQTWFWKDYYWRSHHSSPITHVNLYPCIESYNTWIHLLFVSTSYLDPNAMLWHQHSMIKLKITEPPQCHGKLVTTNIYWNTLSLHISSPRFNRKALTNSLTSTARIKRKGFSNATDPRHVHIWWEWPDGERLPEFLCSDIRGSGR